MYDNKKGWGLCDFGKTNLSKTGIQVAEQITMNAYNDKLHHQDNYKLECTVTIYRQNSQSILVKKALVKM